MLNYKRLRKYCDRWEEKQIRFLRVKKKFFSNLPPPRKSISSDISENARMKTLSQPE
jgi:hypothetical protein